MSSATIRLEERPTADADQRLMASDNGRSFVYNVISALSNDSVGKPSTRLTVK